MKKLIFIGIAIIIHALSFAQVKSYNMLLDSNDILIGDQIKMQLQFISNEDVEVLWPVFNDTLVSQVEILNISEEDSLFESNKYIYQKELTLTSFDSGYYYIPGQTLAYRQKNDTIIRNIFSNPAYLIVNTLEVDTTKAFKPIKAPIEAPFTIKEAMPYVYVFAGFVIIAIGIWYYTRRRKGKEGLFARAPKPKLPAHVIALDALDELKLAKVWQQGHIKKYYTELTDIVRQYIEDRFSVNALEYTTEETIDSLKGIKEINEDIRGRLQDTLHLADMVKFAKMQPLPLEHDVCMNNCVDFVKETMKRREVETEETKETKDVE